MLTSKRQQMQIACKFIQGHRLAQQKQPFFRSANGYTEIPCQRSVFYRAFHKTFRLTVLDAVFGSRSAKAFSVSEQVDGFEKVGFSLAIPAREQICIGGGRNLQFADIPIMEETQFCELHS
jgi:hypothetical protein